MTDRIILKNRAMQRIRQSGASPYGVTFVFLLLSFIVNIIIKKLDEPIMAWLNNAVEFFDRLGYVPNIDVIIYLSLLFITVLDILLQVVIVGFLSYSLNISRKKSAGLENLGDGFGRFWTIFGIFILIRIFVFLWSMLFVIPGIIASYKYRLAYYIALENPEKGPLQCIRESKRLINGYKFDLFILDFSFIGWYLLGALTFGIVLIWKLSYIEVTYSLFYQELAYPFGDKESSSV